MDINDDAPHEACLHHRCGHCLFPERDNPGYHSEFKCSVLARWIESYDDFIRRADAFNLSEEISTSIWEKRFASKPVTRRDCADYLPGNGEDALDCRWFEHTLCLLRLPVCTECCDHFMTNGPESKTTAGE